MPLSNQYPRLVWLVDPGAPGKPAYVAHPHEDGWARVYLQRTNLDGQWWSWTVHWPGRFSNGGMLHDKQAAADAATIGYWDCMAATEDWVKPEPVVVRPILPLPPEARFRAWVEALVAGMTDQTGGELVRQFLVARSNGPSIAGNEDADRWAHGRLSQAYATREYWK